MGTFTVTLGVADPEGRRYEDVAAMVDSGAAYTVLPASILEGLGVAPRDRRSFVLADGRRVERDFGHTWLRLDGREDISPVVFWDEGATPLLGAVTLEIFGLGVDPVNGRLVPVDAFTLAADELPLLSRVRNELRGRDLVGELLADRRRAAEREDAEMAGAL